MKPETATKLNGGIIMKKALFNIFTAAVVFSMAVTMAFAAEPGRGRCFVDADGDGICDNYVSGQGWGHSGHGGHGFRGGRCR